MPEKNGKSDFEAEKAAWESYLRRIEGTPEAAPEKKPSAFRNFLGKLRFWKRKEKPAAAAAGAGQAAPVEEAEFGAAEKPVPEAATAETAEERAIEQIIRDMERRRVEGKKPSEIVEVPELEVKPSERVEKALSELQHMAAVRKKPVEAAAVPAGKKPAIAEEKAVGKAPAIAKEKAVGKAPAIERKEEPALPRLPVIGEKKIEEKPVLQPKLALLPKIKPGVAPRPAVVQKPVVGGPARPAGAKPAAGKAQAKPTTAVPTAGKAQAKPTTAVPTAGKAGAKPTTAVPIIKAKPGKKIGAKPAVKAQAMAAKKAAVKPVKKVPVQKLVAQKLKKIPLVEAAPVVRQAVEYLKVASKTRQWYAQKLQKEKAVLKKKRVKEKVKLKQLVRKAKRRKLSVKEKAVKTRLVKDQRPLQDRIMILEKKLKALQRIAKARKVEEKMIERSAKEAGVVIPKKELHPPAKGPIRLRTREELAEAVNAMRAVAEEVAAAVIRMPETIPQPPEKLSIDSEIDKTNRMAKNLETAFYKRKITVDQFREKLFNYQSQLSELKIRKKLLEEERKRAEAEGAAWEKGTPAGVVGIGYAGRGMPPRPAGTGYAPRGPSPGQAGIGYAARPPPGPIPTAGITPRAARALEKIMETTAAAPRERVIERVIEREAPARPAVPAIEKAAPARPAAPAIERAVPAAPQIEREPAAKPPPVIQKAPAAERAAPTPIIERAPMPGPAKAAPMAGAMPRVQPGAGAVPAAAAVERVIEREAPARPAAPAIEKAAPARPIMGKRPIIRMPLRRGAKRTEPGVPKVSREIEKVIEKKASGKLSKPEIEGFSEEVAKLLREYKIPENQIAAKIQALDSERLVADFHKLIGLIKEQEEAKLAEMIPAASGFETATAINPRKKEEIVASEKEIVKAKIETTFDRLLELVKMKGSIELEDAAKALGLDKKQVKECAEVLEQSSLLKMMYPPIGPMRLAYPGYLKWKERQKQEAREKGKRDKEAKKRGSQ